MRVAKNPSSGNWIGLVLGGIGGTLIGSAVGAMGAIAFGASSVSPTSTPDQTAAALRNAALLSLGASIAGTVGGAALGYHVGGK